MNSLLSDRWEEIVNNQLVNVFYSIKKLGASVTYQYFTENLVLVKVIGDTLCKTHATT